MYHPDRRDKPESEELELPEEFLLGGELSESESCRPLPGLTAALGTVFIS